MQRGVVGNITFPQYFNSDCIKKEVHRKNQLVSLRRRRKIYKARAGILPRVAVRRDAWKRKERSGPHGMRETERPQAIATGLNIIPREVKGSRRFAGRKPR